MISPQQPTLRDVAIDRVAYHSDVFDGMLGVTRRDDRQVVVDGIVQLAEGLRPGTRVRARGRRRARLPPRDVARHADVAHGARRACAPTRFLRATGTTTWRPTLRRRLPKGRCAVYARVFDVVSRVTAKDAKIVRVR
jgi:hypothetical protein